jgi:hypothetical protein
LLLCWLLGAGRTKPRLPRIYISDASTTTGLCGMTLRAGVLSHWSYALTVDDLKRALNINQLDQDGLVGVC